MTGKYETEQKVIQNQQFALLNQPGDRKRRNRISPCEALPELTFEAAETAVVQEYPTTLWEHGPMFLAAETSEENDK